MKKQTITLKGTAYPLGATLMEYGVNFSVFSPTAEAVELLLFEAEGDVNPQVIPLIPEIHKSYNYWHIFVPHLKVNQLYGYRVYGEYLPEKGLLHDGSKVLVDPYAKAIVGEYDRELANAYGKTNLHSCLKSAVIDDAFDWEDEIPPKINSGEAVVYEMHVGGFTQHENSGVEKKLRGTYSGLLEKIPYLKDLGVTAVELMPVFAFDEQDAPNDNLNYWGYSPINFFAPHTGYSSKQKPQEIVDEFKSMVRALHKANIEVYLDVVYNHTTENDAFNDGPTLSMRGFSNSAYYMIDENGKFRNYSGTGNTLNANHSVVRRMILESLQYWVKEMHIDGFRFDLASVLSRDEYGKPLVNPPILWSIDSDPILSNTHIIAEAWDASGLHQVNNFPGDRWKIWNDGFRKTMRKFVKGDAGQVGEVASRFMGSPHQLKARHKPFEPKQSLHFVTCHDGFTMNDLVSYNGKHNWENGENNKDGSNDNNSWNCGVEGVTDDQQIIALRTQQTKNFFTLLFLSHGTPMMLMGDEIQRTQYGNNNPYCQNNALSWMDWDKEKENSEMLSFVKDLIQIKKQYRSFSHNAYFDIEKTSNGNPVVIFHGTKQKEPDWGFESRTLACEIISKDYDEHLYFVFNMYWEELAFELPEGYRWKLVVDTSDDLEAKQYEKSVMCPGRTVLMFEAV